MTKVMFKNGGDTTIFLHFRFYKALMSVIYLLLTLKHSCCTNLSLLHLFFPLRVVSLMTHIRLRFSMLFDDEIVKEKARVIHKLKNFKRLNYGGTTVLLR